LYNYSQTIELVDKALDLEPNSVIALDAKGFILSTQGHYSEAIKYYDKALAVNLDYMYALSDKAGFI
jgi:tetratricopeptide (TPR) repeat protein